LSLSTGDLGLCEAVRLFVERAEAADAGELRYRMLEPVRQYARERLEESLALSREVGDLRNTSMSLFNLGMVELTRGDLDRGATLLEEGARITRELGDSLGGIYSPT
jgi:hypothetical protein